MEMMTTAMTMMVVTTDHHPAELELQQYGDAKRHPRFASPKYQTRGHSSR
jgi:hypothetical protein